jgi:hypothetical protein
MALLVLSRQPQGGLLVRLQVRSRHARIERVMEDRLMCAHDFFASATGLQLTRKHSFRGSLRRDLKMGCPPACAWKRVAPDRPSMT